MKLENVLLFLLCITALMVPSLGAVCVVTDGSKANSVACTCGSVECTSTTGLICYSTYGGGSCRKIGLGAFGYIKEAGNTNCGSVSDRKPILNKATCQAAAKSMDLDDVSAFQVSSPNYPPGCYWSGSSLYYNTRTTSAASCNHLSDFCLCVAASATNTQVHPCGQGTVWHVDSCIVNPCDAGKTVWSKLDSECVNVDDGISTPSFNSSNSSTFTPEATGLGGGWIFLIVIACLWVCFFCTFGIMGGGEASTSFLMACGPCGLVLALAGGATLFALLVAFLAMAPFFVWCAKPQHVAPMICSSLFIK